MRHNNIFKHKVLATVLTIVALAAGHITASAYTMTYTVTGGSGNSPTEFYAQFTDGSTLTNKVSWTYNSTAEISFNLKTNITLTLSNADKHLIVEDNSIGGRGATTLTVSSNDYYIYRVRLLTADGNVIQLNANGEAVTQGGVSECDYWNMTKSFSRTFNSGILFSKIEVSYDTYIPITDAVISGLNASYPVSNTAVEPTPTVTWHGTTLSKGTHYTLSYQNNSAAGTATVYATGKGIFYTNTNVSANYTLVWATYTVRFNKNNNGASGTMANQAFTYNTAQNLTANAFTAPTGYTFNGWNTAAGGSGTSYTDGQSVSNLTAVNGATVDLYAQWTPFTYIIQFYGNGNTSGSMSDMTCQYDSPQNLIPNQFTRKGYTFAGWNTNNLGSGTSYADRQEVLNLRTTPGTVKLYAQWTLNTYTVHFDANGGMGEMADQTSDVTKNLPSNTFTRTGYTFQWWNTQADGSGKSCPDGGSISYALGVEDTDGATINLYAYWRANTYTVTLDNQSATTAGTTEVTATFDAAMPAINVPERTGYTFCGYYTETNGGGTKYYNADGTSAHAWDIASATTLYAQWFPIVPYLDADGNSQNTLAMPLTGTETVLDKEWYVVNHDVTFNLASFGGGITLGHDVNIILADGATMTVTNDDEDIDEAIDCDHYTLSIYAQSTGDNMGGFVLNQNVSQCIGFSDGYVNIYGGNVSVTGSCAFYISKYDLSITGGRVTIDADYVINANKVTLGCAAATDYISFVSQGISNGVDITIKDSQLLTDGKNVYRGSFRDNDNGLFFNTTLIPYIHVPEIVSTSYLDANGNTVNVNATVVDGLFSSYGTPGQTTSYVVNRDVSLGADIVLAGDVNLILADGCTMSINGNDVHGGAITCGNHTLNIYAQSTGDNMGSLEIEALGDDGQHYETYAIIFGQNGNLNIYGGKILFWGATRAIYSSGNISIHGGRVNLGYLEFHGTLTLAYTTPTDYISVDIGYACDGTIIVPADLYRQDTGTVLVTDNYVINNNNYESMFPYGPGTTLYPYKPITLADNADNTAAINEWNGGKADVTLQSRTLWKDGAWNTLCLPFNLDLTEDVCNNESNPLYGATIMTFDGYAWYDGHRSGQVENGNLYLYFEKAMDGNGVIRNDIFAGTPFLVKWDGDGTNNIVNPVFTSVTIDNDDYWKTAMTTEEGSNDYTHEGNVTFKATYSPVTFDAENKSVLFMGGNSTLYYPENGATIGAFRAYFQLNNGLSADNLPANAVKMFFGERPTGLSPNPSPVREGSAGAWYTIDGRKVQAPSLGEGRGGLPSGIYIHNGKKVVIK